MLRWLVLGLAAANLVFYAWTLGWLDDVTGVRARGDSEPARLARQVRPETVIILPPSGASATPNAPASSSTGTPPASSTPGPSATPANTPPNAASSDTPGPAVGSNISTTVSAGSEASAGSTATSCVEAGPFTAAQIAAAVAALQGAQPPIPAGSWAELRTEKPGSWIVYMGRYPNREALERKQEELRRIRGAVFEEVRDNPGLSPGLSLGRFDQRVKADQALESLSLRGLRTARVVQLAAPASSHVLRAANASGDLANQLAALRFEGTARKFAACGTN